MTAASWNFDYALTLIAIPALVMAIAALTLPHRGPQTQPAAPAPAPAPGRTAAPGGTGTPRHVIIAPLFLTNLVATVMLAVPEPTAPLQGLLHALGGVLAVLSLLAALAVITASLVYRRRARRARKARRSNAGGTA